MSRMCCLYNSEIFFFCNISKVFLLNFGATTISKKLFTISFATFSSSNELKPNIPPYADTGSPLTALLKASN